MEARIMLEASFPQMRDDVQQHAKQSHHGFQLSLE